VLVVLGAGAPLAPAQAPQLFLNNQSVSLRNPTLTQGEQLFVPLGEFARLLGAETTVSYESVTLRWGRNSTTLPTEQLVARGPLLYISLAQLAELLGIKMLKARHGVLSLQYARAFTLCSRFCKRGLLHALGAGAVRAAKAQ
jgi:hypothetical protein